MKVMRLSVVALLAFGLLATGCASKKQTTKQIGNLQAQVGALTDEVARLDRALQETHSSIQAEESRGADLQSQLGQSKSRLSSLKEEESVIKGIYRTPSGFELPSSNIQEALKNAGYYQGAVDGKIGPATRDAIRAFQKDQGLNPDGVVGRRTWSKLKTHIERPGK